MSVEQLGRALTSEFSVSGAEARLYEEGAIIEGSAGETVVRFDFPMIGRPHIAEGDTASASLFGSNGIIFEPPTDWPLGDVVPILKTVLSERLALLPTGQRTEPVSITLGEPEAVDPTLLDIVNDLFHSDDRSKFRLPASAALQERQLYDVAIKGDDGQWNVVAPHAEYFRSTWSDFGIAHITDVHIARRIDYFRETLRELGRHEAAEKMYNWNDRFRGFIRYANYLHSIGELDIILATGDILDYLFENNDDEDGGGNALFARQLLLGQAPGPEFPDVEELRVPIFMVPGNHDYRKYPYRLIFELDIGPFNVKKIQSHSGYHLHWRDALALARGDNSEEFPELNADSAARMVEVDTENRPYATHLADRRSYVIQLGPHRIPMLDSGWDTGMVTSRVDGLLAWLKLASEDEMTFVGGSPNSEGVSDEELELVRTALDDTPDEGLFILGVHSPLFNLWGNEYPYFLRETQRQAQSPQDKAFLDRHDSDQEHPTWFPPGGDQTPSYVKRGDTDDYLDYGVSRGETESLIERLAGVGSDRPADLILSGHTHRHNEFRIGSADGDLAYHLDFYTQNPGRYYPTRFMNSDDFSSHDVDRDTARTYVEVATEVPANAMPWELPWDAMFDYTVDVPPYPNPLSSATDPARWWAEHRPIVLQTGPLGPLENSQVSFSGFRVISVVDNVIDEINHVSMEKLVASDYRMEWGEVIRPDPPRQYQHLSRSREFGAPAASGVPSGHVFPPTGDVDVVYRDEQGRLIELWQNTAGKRGSGNLTRAAGGPTPAAGDPYMYLDPLENLLVTLYRGTDGIVHSLYWSTGAVGHDNLSGSAGAPRAVGDPVGFFNTHNNHHNVVYRSGDGHLHTLYWTGPGAVGHEDTTALADAGPATGDPAAYFDPKSGEHVVIYRGSGGHIHSMYWTTGAVGDDSLTGSVGAPLAAEGAVPIAYKTDFDNAHQVTYRGQDGHLHEMWWVGPGSVNYKDLTVAAGAPEAASDPTGFYSPRTKTKHVFYRSVDGHVNELSWQPAGGTPKHVDLSVMARAPPAADQPVGFDGPPHRNVVYRGKDNQIHEIRWRTTAFHLRDVILREENVHVFHPRP